MGRRNLALKSRGKERGARGRVLGKGFIKIYHLLRNNEIGQS